MGMYTTYSIDATLKPQYREQFAKLYDLRDNGNNNPEDDVKSVGLDILSELITGQRWQAFIYGGWESADPVTFDKETGHWVLETELKDYSENVDPNDWHSPEKPKKSSELFSDLIPTLFEEKDFEMTRQYEEDPLAEHYILKAGKLIQTNKEECRKAYMEYYYGG